MARRKSPVARPYRRPGAAPARTRPAEDAPLWLYGTHAVLAALGNPRRRCLRLLATAEAARALADRGEARARAGAEPAAEIAARREIDKRLPEGAVHQGLALLVEPLAQPPLEAVLAADAHPGCAGRRLVVVLDQVTDPQNVGAVLRSAAAFGAAGVLAPRRHAAPESGALAKAASGAIERVPYLRVANLARALEALKQAGYWRVGLAEDAARDLAEADPGGAVGLVLGAEGGGLRRLTREACDLVVRLPTPGALGTLNVSTAAAVALYELLGRRRAQD